MCSRTGCTARSAAGMPGAASHRLRAGTPSRSFAGLHGRRGLAHMKQPGRRAHSLVPEPAELTPAYPGTSETPGETGTVSWSEGDVLKSLETARQEKSLARRSRLGQPLGERRPLSAPRAVRAGAARTLHRFPGRLNNQAKTVCSDRAGRRSQMPALAGSTLPMWARIPIPHHLRPLRGRVTRHRSIGCAG